MMLSFTSPKKKSDIRSFIKQPDSLHLFPTDILAVTNVQNILFLVSYRVISLSGKSYLCLVGQLRVTAGGSEISAISVCSESGSTHFGSVNCS